MDLALKGGRRGSSPDLGHQAAALGTVQQSKCCWACTFLAFSTVLGGCGTTAHYDATNATALVTVEEGGVVVLPCNASIVTSCYLGVPDGWFMTSFVDGYGRQVQASANNATHCSCSLPPGDAEAPVDVSFMQHGSATPLPAAARIAYVALWTTALARRPYLSTDTHAEVVLSIHSSVKRAFVSVTIPAYACTSNEEVPATCELLARTPVRGGVATTVQFPLAHAPQVAQQLPVTVTLFRESGEPLERQLFLTRVPPPPQSVGSFVQVDYAHKSLLVNGKPLLGVGYYDSQSIGPSNLTRQGAAGINWGMRYLLSNDPSSNLTRQNDSFIQNYFDWSFAAGMYVMFDLFRYFEAIAKEGNSTELWANISGQVRKFRNHPALLGYYICDDCTTQYLERQESAKTPTLDVIYRALKDLDPYHPVIGAEECANAYTFTTGNDRISAPSLDVVMVENYVSKLTDNAHTGSLDSIGMDGSFSGWPLTWEPIVNCPGPWLVAERKDLSTAEKSLIMYSMSWLSVVLANIPLQLHFRLFPFTDTIRSDPVYEKILTQVGRYAQVANQVQDFLLRPPSGIQEPRLLPRTGRGACTQCAAIWRHSGPDFCAVVVVVNTENVTAHATFRLEGAEHWPTAGYASLTRVDGSGGALFWNSTLEVTIMPFDTQVYTTECVPAMAFV